MGILSDTAEAPASPRRSIGGAVVAVALAGLAIATGIGSLQLGLWTTLGPGAGFFPLVLACVLLIASVIWGLQQWRGIEDEDIEPGEVANGPWRIAAVVGTLVGAALLLEPLGFQLTILVFLLVHLRVLARVRWLVAVPVMLFGSFGIFILFDAVLRVPLPTASIPFLSVLGL